MPTPAAPGNPHHVKPIAWLWAGAAIAASIGGAVFVTRWTPMSRERKAPVAVPSAAVIAARDPSRFRLPLERPSIAEPSAAEAGAADAGDRRRYLEAFSGATAAYRSGDFVAASRAFERISNQYPSAAGAAFSLGVSKLLAGDAAGAIDPLTAAKRLSTGPAEDDARWYLAVALERADRRDAAAAALDDLCERSGARKASACAAASSLRAP